MQLHTELGVDEVARYLRYVLGPQPLVSKPVLQAFHVQAPPLRSLIEPIEEKSKVKINLVGHRVHSKSVTLQQL